MSSEKFEDLEDELKSLHEDINSKITSKVPKLSGGNESICLGVLVAFVQFNSTFQLTS